MSFLRLTNISKQFGGVRALNDVNLEIEVGEVHCLAGENGSGKSTLIKIISGLQAPEAGGKVEINETEFTHLTPQMSTMAGIQVIYQDLCLFPNLTVAENIAVGEHLGRPHLVDWKSIMARAERAMATIGISLPLRAKVSDLSIASRQLVAICRALAAEARLLIMDEPTASLTRTEIESLLHLISSLKSKGISILFVSHKLEEVLRVCDRVTVLRDGEQVGTFSTEGMSSQKLGYLMTGKAFDYRILSYDLTDAPVVLSVSNLSRRGDYKDISFEVKTGEILGIVGMLGSGRTELALSLFGMNPPDSGKIRLSGKQIRMKSNRDAIQHGIAYVSEDRLTLGLVQEQSISSNIVVTVQDMLQNSLGLVDQAKRNKTVGRWIRDLAIKVSNPENPVNTLSGGNQQRVVLAKWMAREPLVLILDSPTVGVDINAKDGIYEIIRSLAARGVAVIMISDEIPEVLFHSHRICVMNKGRLSGGHLPHTLSENTLGDLINA
ncbi:sugar ABC transporter ATP-binding protein [Rhizobium sp. Root1203]|uniref:sugar ABC transporter ATP-binding protein n=1 Tax=Rhizobium sp. Root1203 TaxID=1736427 RepID=UPI000B2614AD|nr:sugar ABC transporter ATP-binding protein [Rhizobium sp. Root1203]